MLEVKFYDSVDDSLLKFAVIVSQSNGKWVFCKHKERDAYEVPGGHREAGESILETAKRELQEETGATITIEEIDNIGRIEIAGTNKKSIDDAMRIIKGIVAVPEVGEVYKGKVRSIMPYGAFVEFLPGKDGLLHISEIDWKRLETVEEAGIKEGDEIDVKLLDIDPKTGKFKLSRKVLLPKPERQERPEKKDK